MFLMFVQLKYSMIIELWLMFFTVHFYLGSIYRQHRLIQKYSCSTLWG